MKKIRGFKLEVRPKEVQRLAKKAGVDLSWLGVRPSPNSVHEGLPKAVEAASKLLVPAVLYDTFTGKEAGSAGPDPAGLAPIPGVAFSVVLATLGPGLEARRIELGDEEPQRARLYGLVAESALAEAVRFAASLIESEAALENCELSPLNPLSGAEALAAALDMLDGSKIAVSLGDEGLQPADSCVVTLSWLSKSRGRKSKA